MEKYINNFGSFQNDVGKASASFSLIGSYIISGIIVVIAIIIMSMGFLYKDTSRTASNFICDKDEKCLYDEKCFNNSCLKYKKNYIASTIVGLVLILIAIIIIFLTKFNYNLVNSNKSYSQIVGTATELNMLKKILS